MRAAVLRKQLPVGDTKERSPGGNAPGPLPVVAMVTAAARWGQRGQGGTGGDREGQRGTPGRGRALHGSGKCGRAWGSAALGRAGTRGALRGRVHRWERRETPNSK